MSQAGGLSSSGGGGGGTVTSVSGTANQVAVANGTTTPVISLIGPYTPATYTAHGVLLGEGTSSIVAVSPNATSGIPLISQGSSSNPAYGTAVVAGGGTGDTSFTAYSVITGGTTSTGALQNVSGVGTSGQVLTSNGAAALPTWQTAAGASVTFSASLNANTGALTGDGTQATIPFNHVLFDSASGFNISTGVYTFPSTGVYLLNTTIFAAALSALNNNNQIFVFFNINSGSLFRTYELSYQNAGTSTGEITITSSFIYSATANDTVSVTVDVTGNGSKNIIFAGAGSIYSGVCLFSGFLV